jgi:uncharacterized protein YcgL (UPF0745 family)
MASKTGEESKTCWIYKDRRRGETYLYLAERDGFDVAPRALLDAMGDLEFVMELDLHPDRKLARARTGEVLRALTDKGYYLQLPPVGTAGQRRLQ